MNVSDLLGIKNINPVSIHPSVTVRELVLLLRDDPIGAVIIHDEDGALDGFVTERDLMHAVARHGSAILNQRASAVATTAMVHCLPEDSLTDVAHLMTDRGIQYIPVRSGGRILNIISVVDILEARMRDRRIAQGMSDILFFAG
jgi:CBS domain-containing protein